MGKKIFAYLIIFFVFVFSVSASVSIVGVKDKYNLGDIVDVSGQVSLDSEFDGLFTLSFVCGGGRNFPLPSFPLTLSAGEIKNFPSDFLIPELKISSAMSGSCKVKGVLSSGEFNDQGYSTDFLILKDLKGDFDVPKKILQLGDNLIIDGNISNIQGDFVSGSAEIYLQNPERGKYLLDIVSLDYGVIYSDSPLTNLVPGTYNVDILVNDVYGNTGTFENIGSFSIVNNLILDLSIKDEKPFPGDKISISGKIKPESDSDFDSGIVTIRIGDFEEEFDVNNELYYEYVLPDDIKSGNNFAEVSVEDNFGNKGESIINFSVEPIIKSIEIQFNNLSILPGDELEITPVLLDQGGEGVSNSVEVQVFDLKNKLFFKEISTAGKIIKILIPEEALPGEWTLKTSYNEFKKDLKFTVETIKKIEADLDGQNLIITNIGNVPYDNPIEINIGSEISFVKKKSLKPLQKFKIDLGKKASTGVYTVSVLSAEKPNVFRDVRIEKTSSFSFTLVYWILAILVIILVITFLFKKKRKSVNYYVPKKQDYFPKVKFKKKVKISTEVPDEKKPSYTREDAVRDYRRRLKKEMLRDSRDLQRKNYKGKDDYITVGKKVKEEKREEKKGNSGANVFNIFD